MTAPAYTQSMSYPFRQAAIPTAQNKARGKLAAFLFFCGSGLLAGAAPASAALAAEARAEGAGKPVLPQKEAAGAMASLPAKAEPKAPKGKHGPAKGNITNAMMAAAAPQGAAAAPNGAEKTSSKTPSAERSGKGLSGKELPEQRLAEDPTRPKPEAAAQTEDGAKGGEAMARALRHLKKTLRQYHQRSLHVKIQRETYISALNKTEKALGEIYIQGGKFRISMERGQRELMIFDGSALWLQPDRNEKAALKFRHNPAAAIFPSLFDEERFFKTAQAESALKAGQGVYVYSLKLLSESYGVSKILLSCGKHISKIKIFYEGSGDWQSYGFSNIWFKKAFPKSLFAFSAQGFEIIEN